MKRLPACRFSLLESKKSARGMKSELRMRFGGLRLLRVSVGVGMGSPVRNAVIAFEVPDLPTLMRPRAFDVRSFVLEVFKVSLFISHLEGRSIGRVLVAALSRCAFFLFEGFDVVHHLLLSGVIVRHLLV